MVANFLLNCQSNKAPCYPCLTNANPTPRYLEFSGDFAGLLLVFAAFLMGLVVLLRESDWTSLVLLVKDPNFGCLEGGTFCDLPVEFICQKT